LEICINVKSFKCAFDLTRFISHSKSLSIGFSHRDDESAQNSHKVIENILKLLIFIGVSLTRIEVNVPVVRRKDLLSTEVLGKDIVESLAAVIAHLLDLLSGQIVG